MAIPHIIIIAVSPMSRRFAAFPVTRADKHRYTKFWFLATMHLTICWFIEILAVIWCYWALWLELPLTMRLARQFSEDAIFEDFIKTWGNTGLPLKCPPLEFRHITLFSEQPQAIETSGDLLGYAHASIRFSIYWGGTGHHWCWFRVAFTPPRADVTL